MPCRVFFHDLGELGTDIGVELSKIAGPLAVPAHGVDGWVRYQHCPCGRWGVVLDPAAPHLVLAAAGLQHDHDAECRDEGYRRPGDEGSQQRR
jgi:hypothetical protein